MSKKSDKTYNGIDIFSVIKDFPKRKVRERSVLLGLFSFLNIKRAQKGDLTVWPGTTALAERLCYSETETVSLVDLLVKDGHISQTAREGIVRYDLTKSIKSPLRFISGNDPFLVIPVIKEASLKRSQVIALECAMVVFYEIPSLARACRVDVRKVDVAKRLGRSEPEIGYGFKELEEIGLIKKIKRGFYDFSELYKKSMIQAPTVKSQSETEWEETTAIVNRWAKA